MVWNQLKEREEKVHPHACGEYALPSYVQVPVAGSSPRLWGVYALLHRQTHPVRFIPTPVGSIRVDSVIDGLAAVHPHACGEYSDTELQGPIWSGSSPRLWGVSRRYGN